MKQSEAIAIKMWVVSFDWLSLISETQTDEADLTKQTKILRIPGMRLFPQSTIIPVPFRNAPGFYC